MKEQYVNIIKFAMQMEMNGHEFFKEKAQLFRDATTRELFERLARVELSHYEFLKKELEKYVDNPEEYVLDKDFIENEGTKDIFQERAQSQSIDTCLKESDVPDVTILRMAYLIERDFAEFYEEAVETVEDEGLKSLFKQLSDWEYTHESLFKNEYKRLRNEYMTLPWGG